MDSVTVGFVAVRGVERWKQFVLNWCRVDSRWKLTITDSKTLDSDKIVYQI